jgi:hypothetical protein
MIQKYPICPDRIRTIPEQFSWVDHRLVRDRHIELLTHEAATLYLFLVTVADCQGLSYYADSSLCKRLAIDEATLAEARGCLQHTGLVAYKKPLYQVLDLSPVASRRNENLKLSGVAVGSPMSLGEILRQIAGGAP